MSERHRAILMLKMLRRTFIPVLGGAFVARGADMVRRATERLSEEASAFQRIAVDLVSTETLRQRALKPSSRTVLWREA